MAEQKKLRIYTLNDLSPEVRAVTFAKCSRSPEPFNQIAAELTEKKSSKFHEKWVVGYGHSSVAEHAVLSIAIENVSIIATKVIEDNRLASYTEKSTRYQVFDKNTYYKPAKIMNSEFAAEYEKVGDFLFEVYEEFTLKVTDHVAERFSKPKDMPEGLYKSKCKGKICDIIRYILPAATLTNLGMTINARNLEHAIAKMLSHPLDEIKEIGRAIKETATKVCPTLIKYADENAYLKQTNEELRRIALNLRRQCYPRPDPRSTSEAVTLVDYDKDGENKLVASLLYCYSNLPYQQIKQKVDSMAREEKEKIIDEALKHRAKFDRPLRELEHIYYTFDLLMDYGAFRDVQRHRMCTQTNPLLTCDYGYDTPEAIVKLGLKDNYDETMKKAADFYSQLKDKFPYEAQYLVPLAYKKRVLITCNLRELHHFIPLRSGKTGHISYRRIAQKMWDELNKVQPLMAKYIKVDMQARS